MEMANLLGGKKNNNKELWKIKRRSQTKQTCAFSIRDKEGNEKKSRRHKTERLNTTMICIKMSEKLIAKLQNGADSALF